MIAASCPTAPGALRTADVPTCVVTRTLSSYGDRTLAAAGSCLWNSFPVQLRDPDITYGLFRRQQKGGGHLFPDARACLTSNIWSLRKNYSLVTNYTNQPADFRVVRSFSFYSIDRQTEFGYVSLICPDAPMDKYAPNLVEL